MDDFAKLLTPIEEYVADIRRSNVKTTTFPFIHVTPEMELRKVVGKVIAANIHRSVEIGCRSTTKRDLIGFVFGTDNRVYVMPSGNTESLSVLSVKDLLHACVKGYLWEG